MKMVNSIVDYFTQKPGTLAIVGFAGVIIVSLVDIGQLLLYISVAVGILGLLAYNGKESTNKKKTARRK